MVSLSFVVLALPSAFVITKSTKTTRKLLQLGGYFATMSAKAQGKKAAKATSAGAADVPLLTIAQGKLSITKGFAYTKNDVMHLSKSLRMSAIPNPKTDRASVDHRLHARNTKGSYRSWSRPTVHWPAPTPTAGAAAPITAAPIAPAATSQSKPLSDRKYSLSKPRPFDLALTTIFL